VDFERGKILDAIFLGQSLLLSTTVPNDNKPSSCLLYKGIFDRWTQQDVIVYYYTKEALVGIIIIKYGST